MNRTIIVFILILSMAITIFLTKQSPDREESAPPQARRPRASAPHTYDPPAAPARPILPGELGVRPPSSLTNHPARIREIINAGKTSELQSAAVAWFRDDPLAVSEWLDRQPDLEAFSSAISAIAYHLSETNDLESALTWAESVPDKTLRNDTYHGILGIALRERQITVEQLDLTGLPDEIISDLQSGAPVD